MFFVFSQSQERVGLFLRSGGENNILLDALRRREIAALFAGGPIFTFRSVGACAVRIDVEVRMDEVAARMVFGILSVLPFVHVSFTMP